MKKIISISAITALVLLTGCWEGSSSGVSAPDFATKMAKVDNTENVVKALFVNDKGPLEGNIGPRSIEDKNIKLPKQLNFITKYVSNNIYSLIKRADSTNCAYYKYENEYSCKEGSYKEIDIIKKDGSKCIIDQKIIGDKCKMEENEGWDETNFDGLYEVNFQVPVYEDGSFPEDKVGQMTRIMNLTFNATEIYDEGEDSFRIDGVTNLKLVDIFGYEEKNNTYISNNIFQRVVKGNLEVKIYEDKYLDYLINSKMNWSVKIKDNAVLQPKFYRDINYTKTLNGWYDIYLEDRDYAYDKTKGQITYSARNGVAAENFVKTYEINSSNFSKITISGKIGNACIGGLVNFTTNAVIERNESENYRVLPYAGQLKLTGAENTEALVTYKYEDNNKSKSYVEINATNGNKVYRDRYRMRDDARRYCPQFLEDKNRWALDWLIEMITGNDLVD